MTKEIEATRADEAVHRVCQTNRTTDRPAVLPTGHCVLGTRTDRLVRCNSTPLVFWTSARGANTWLALLVSLSVLLRVSDAVAGKSRVPDYQYESEPQYSAVDYTDDNSILCYVCTLHHSDGHTAGFPGCNFTFSSRRIPQMKCEGHCEKTYRLLDNMGSYEIRRGCLPNCKPVKTETTHTQCCEKKLCNGGTTAAVRVRAHVIPHVICLLVLYFVLGLH